MKKGMNMANGSGHTAASRRGSSRNWLKGSLAVLGLGILVAVSGCETPYSGMPVEQLRNQANAGKSAEALTLREGDVLKIAFPGTPNLDTTQTIRRDGKITLPLVGEFAAAGMAPSDMEKELVRLYAPQLVSKEVSVTVVSSTFVVFVSGAVIRPGKIISDHPLSALEAIMEAGGFDSAKADAKSVVVLRQEGGQTKNYVVNLKLVLEGKQSELFYLKPSDIVYVPERFSWF